MIRNSFRIGPVVEAGRILDVMQYGKERVKCGKQTPAIAIFGIATLVVLLSCGARQVPVPKDATLEDRVERFENGLRPAILVHGEATETWSIEERMAHYNVPAVSLVIVEDGEIVLARAYGYSSVAEKTPTTTETAFSVGSVSKMGTAAGILRLAADGALDIDTDINQYLTTWKIPTSPLSAESPVTLRGIMSHSGGLTVSGFPDFLPGEPLPTILQTLDGQPPAKHEPVRVFYTPGSAARYSGGGTTVSQLLIQDVAGEPFADVMHKLVFAPLSMTRSTYVSPAPESHEPLARAYDANGDSDALPRGWHSFPETAASGLWTTPTDIAKLFIALLESYHGESDFLPQTVVRDMMQEVGPSYFGLGPELSGEGFDRRFYHGGSNNSYKAHAEMHLERRSGLFIFTNSSLGSQLYAEIRRAVADAFDWPYYRPVVVAKVTDVDGFRASLDQFVGTYRVPEPVPLDTRRILTVRPLTLSRVSRNGDRLVLDFPGYDDRKHVLVPLSPSRFVVDGYYGAKLDLLRVEFVSAGGNQSPAMLFYHDGYSATAMRTNEPVDAGPAPERH